jgi:protein-S-isoprenylcysteine O-methyltransferase Ste14
VVLFGRSGVPIHRLAPGSSCRGWHRRNVTSTRNPGYLSLPMIYVGLVNLANALWVILLLPEVLLVVQRDVIECEEHYLEA